MRENEVTSRGDIYIHDCEGLALRVTSIDLVLWQAPGAQAKNGEKSSPTLSDVDGLSDPREKVVSHTPCMLSLHSQYTTDLLQGSYRVLEPWKTP